MEPNRERSHISCINSFEMKYFFVWDGECATLCTDLATTVNQSWLSKQSPKPRSRVRNSHESHVLAYETVTTTTSLCTKPSRGCVLAYEYGPAQLLLVVGDDACSIRRSEAIYTRSLSEVWGRLFSSRVDPQDGHGGPLTTLGFESGPYTIAKKMEKPRRCRP